MYLKTSERLRSGSGVTAHLAILEYVVNLFSSFFYEQLPRAGS